MLQVSRSGYYQWRARPVSSRSLANKQLDAQVKQVHHESQGTYGRPRITHFLRTQHQLRVGHERVRQSLLRQGLQPVYKKAYVPTTDSNHSFPIAPNVLNRRFTTWRVDAAWLGDITYLSTGEGWLYLAAILDLGSRRIVGWSMGDRITSDLTCQALNMAYWHHQPKPGLIMHTDRGVQYASAQYQRLLRHYGMTPSMSRRGNAWDNAPMESFFKSLKVERTHRLKYTSQSQAKLDIMDWIEGFYNRKRIHSAIGYQTPMDKVYVSESA